MTSVQAHPYQIVNFATYLTFSRTGLLERLAVVANELADAYRQRGFNLAVERREKMNVIRGMDPSSAERTKENAANAAAVHHSAAVFEATASVDALRVEYDFLVLLLHIHETDRAAAYGQ